MKTVSAFSTLLNIRREKQHCSGNDFFGFKSSSPAHKWRLQVLQFLNCFLLCRQITAHIRQRRTPDVAGQSQRCSTPRPVDLSFQFPIVGNTCYSLESFPNNHLFSDDRSRFCGWHAFLTTGFRRLLLRFLLCSYAFTFRLFCGFFILWEHGQSLRQTRFWFPMSAPLFGLVLFWGFPVSQKPRNRFRRGSLRCDGISTFFEELRRSSPLLPTVFFLRILRPSCPSRRLFLGGQQKQIARQSGRVCVVDDPLHSFQNSVVPAPLCR